MLTGYEINPSGRVMHTSECSSRSCLARNAGGGTDLRINHDRLMIVARVSVLLV